jgi:hypothetical protein
MWSTTILRFACTPVVPNVFVAKTQNQPPTSGLTSWTPFSINMNSSVFSVTDFVFLIYVTALSHYIQQVIWHQMGR